MPRGRTRSEFARLYPGGLVNKLWSATMGKLALLTIVFAIGLAPTPIATAEPSSACDSNYSGPCVPIDTDVDCAGGSGNGPSYVAGPVYVAGDDIYDLDRDGDGVGCQS